MYLNRIVTILTVIAGVIVAGLPVLADMDTTSTAGVLGGLASISVVVVKWLDGWQKFESRTDDALNYQPFRPDYLPEVEGTVPRVGQPVEGTVTSGGNPEMMGE